jgi:hypothetical protein
MQVSPAQDGDGGALLGESGCSDIRLHIEMQRRRKRNGSKWEIWDGNYTFNNYNWENKTLELERARWDGRHL